jgi:hypothetical protein
MIEPPVHEEQRREVRDADAHVRVRAVGPHVAQGRAAGARELHREHERRRLEAGAVDDAVDVVVPAARSHDPGRVDPRDRVGHELGVRALDRRQEVGREEDPLAPECVVRPHPAPQVGVPHLVAHEQRRGEPADAADRARMADQQRDRLRVLEDVAAPERL